MIGFVDFKYFLCSLFLVEIEVRIPFAIHGLPDEFICLLVNSLNGACLSRIDSIFSIVYNIFS